MRLAVHCLIIMLLIVIKSKSSKDLAGLTLMV